jgi:dihydrofolate reductase/thymidylate synthase
MFHSVVCVDNKYGISKAGAIPWHYAEDLKFFKDLTINNVVIMGRKTYESIGHPLPNRINIIITKSADLAKSADYITFSDLWQCVEYCSTNFKNKNIFVIGGSEIYKWFINNRLISYEYVTSLNKDYNCDNFYTDTNQPKKLIYTCDDYNRFLVEHFNTEEYNFLSLAKDLLNGNSKSDRTGTGTLSTFGNRLTFDLSNNTFPLLTTRKMFLRGIFEELMLYIRGQTNSKILEAKGINVWRGNTSREFLDKCNLQLPVGDMGASYGFLFRHFGAEYKTCLDDYEGKGFDQLYYVIDKLKNNPTDRRIIISLWDPNNINKCPLPPCLYNYQFYTHDKKLYCMMTQRSSDYAVAGGWNIATGALLTYLLASVCDLEPQQLIWNIGDTHIYNNLLNQIKEQITRRPYLFPKIFINKKNKIEDYEFSDIKLLCYNSHSTIQLNMNV